MNEQLFLYIGLVPLIGIFGQWLAWRLRLPSILFLLLMGLALGQWVKIDQILNDITGSEHPLTALELLFPWISLSVAVILFEGGLSLRLNELKQAGGLVFRLTTATVLISWTLTTLALYFVLQLHFHLAALLGAIFVVTGPTVVAPLLRNIRPVPKVASMVKWEGIVVDPIGALLAVLVLEQIRLSSGGEYQLTTAIWTLLGTCAVGLLIGFLAAAVLTLLMAWYWVPDFLHGVSILAAVLAAFAISNWLRAESGLITVTMMGIFMANQRMVGIKHIVEFKEHLGILLISCLFVVLGSRLDLGQIQNLGWNGVVFILLLILLIRPASVLLGLIGTDSNWKERVFMSFLAPRGIVAAAITSLMALHLQSLARQEPGMEIYAEQARQLVPITFLVIIGTVGVYGLSAGPLARRLGLSDADPRGLLIAGADPWIRELASILQRHEIPLIMVDTNFRNVSAAKMAGLRAYCASVLSDTVHEEADLSGIGRLLAMTPSDEVNLLACREYAHVFGRANVFQLPLNPKEAGTRSTKITHLPGRVLFDGSLFGRIISERLAADYELKATTLTEEFGWAQFQQRYGPTARVLFLISPKQRLQVITNDWKKVPVARQVVVALVPRIKNGSSPPARSENLATSKS